ncbi:MAG: phosphoenolpyruvate carboxykinase (ATP) [Anaerolineaceae bacterium]|nr:phosphoenolpyruvate carboxykinase (ATP) [Anaerolineaceae bacterium]
MQNTGCTSSPDLKSLGIDGVGSVFWNLSEAQLIEQAVCRKEGVLTAQGALSVQTGKHKGRSPKDKFFVKHGPENNLIDWGETNLGISQTHFDKLHRKVAAYFQGRDVFVQDVIAGADSSYELKIRIITEKAWIGLLARNLFREIPKRSASEFKPEFTLIQTPGLFADPEQDGTNSGTFIAIDLSDKLAVIGGTGYGGEVKKSIFSIMNYFLPLRGVLPMHCSANIGKHGDVALFFGLSGTGKTTLSSDPNRHLIGDDEHGWTKYGVFNFEGGCYAKTIRLNRDWEPIIWQASQQFGSVLENVVINPQTRVPDFNDASLTENIRAAYPLKFIAGHVPDGKGASPQNIFFLSADAFGVLPPVAKLSKEQAMYYFLLGYTSKLAGTETGLGKEPQATFSIGFGAPFFPLNPRLYARLLGEKIEECKTNVWLINTGWRGGPYGVGKRYDLPYTRAIIDAALNDHLQGVPYTQEPYFGLHLPTKCPGVPNELLNPRLSWPDSHTYEEYAQQLLEDFKKNAKQFSDFFEKPVVHTKVKPKS